MTAISDRAVVCSTTQTVTTHAGTYLLVQRPITACSSCATCQAMLVLPTLPTNICCSCQLRSLPTAGITVHSLCGSPDGCDLAAVAPLC
jgi:hypothetical protein